MGYIIIGTLGSIIIITCFFQEGMKKTGIVLLIILFFLLNRLYVGTRVYVDMYEQDKIERYRR